MIDALRKRWQGDGTGKGRRESADESPSPQGRRQKSKFAMIEKKRRGRDRGRQDSQEISKQLMLQAASSSADPLQGLLALQLGQNFEMKDKRSRRHHQRKSSSGSSSSSESEKGSGDRRLKGHSKAVKNYQDSKKRMFRQPVKYIRRYVKAMEEELGAQEKPYRGTDYNKRIFWGKNKTLQRCHYLEDRAGY